jgi:hypothetical protein
MLGSVFAQVNVPLTKTDLDDIQREREIIKMMNINLSQTWLFMVKDNLISSNKLLVSEIYYNNQGLPERIYFFNQSQELESFTVVKYNKQNLPFEEIRFLADSSLLNGIMYVYNELDFLEKQINYNKNSEIVSVFEHQRKNDTVFITEYDKNEKIATQSYIVIDNIDGFELTGKIISNSSQNDITEKQIFEYDDMALLRKKIIFEGGQNTGHKDFVYNDDGALVKSTLFGATSNVLSSNSYEYDSYGNVNRIIEREEKDNSTKVFVIKYLTRTK